MTFQQPAQPGSGDDFKPSQHPEWLGALFLVWPTKVNEKQAWNDKYEPVETVSADMVILDRVDPETGQPVTLSDVMVFGRVLVAQLKSNLKSQDTNPVLGRLGKRPTPKGDAWELGNFAPADVGVAEAYVNAHPRNVFSQPAQAPFGATATASLPPTQNPWDAAPATAPAAAPPATGWGAPAPDLAGFLRSKGMDPSSMAPEQIKMIANTFPDVPK